MSDIIIDKAGIVFIGENLNPDYQYGLRFTTEGGLLLGRSTRSGNLILENGKAKLNLSLSEREKLSQYKNVDYNLFSITEGKDIAKGKVVNKVQEHLKTDEGVNVGEALK